MPPVALVFAQAAPSQHDRIEALLRAAFEPYVKMLGHRMTYEIFGGLRPDIEKGNVHVGLDNGAVVAAAVLSRQGNAVEIDFLAVAPDRQGSGIGTEFLAHIERIARADGVSALQLHTAEIREDLLHLYRRHGFEEVCRAPPEHGKDPHLRVHMRKGL